MDTLLRDLRVSVRLLLRQPGFAATAILTLSLGIGATTAIFSVLNAVLLRPLPFGDPDRIVAVTSFYPKTGVRPPNLSAPDFHDYHDQSRSFDALAYYAGRETSVTVDGAADYASVHQVTPEFFDALRVGARLGRLLSTDEGAPGGPLAVVVTDAFWRRALGSDPRALGSTLKFSDRIFTVVGVLPPGVRFPARADIYFAAAAVPGTPSRGGHNYRVVGRLRDGVSVEQAGDEMTAIGRRLEEQYPNTNSGKSVAVPPLKEELVGSTRQTLFVLLAAVSFVLLIACANVANLLLARASARGREMVVRAAVGAGRWRIVRQLLTESLTLGVLAGVAGIFLARIGVLAVVALAPADLPRVDQVRVDLVALGVTVLVALASSVIFGLAPALQVSRVQLVEGLRQGSKGSALGARGGWARHAIVISEVALAVVLVVTAGLLGRSLAALSSVDMGFDAERLLALRTAVPITGPATWPRVSAFYRDVLPELRALPGVTAVGGVMSLPTLVLSNGSYVIRDGTDPAELSIQSPQAILNVVTPDYFRTMRIPIRSGRDFTDGDRAETPMVAIVNESLARRSFPGQDPIGRRIQAGLDSPAPMTIVGVVADVRTWGPARGADAEIYMPYEQHPGPANALNLVVRANVAEPLALVETMRRVMQRKNPDVPVTGTMMESTLDAASATPRFRAFLLALFAVVALLLAAAGIYGVMAYTVGQRTPEIGVRVALGATPSDVLRIIMRQGAVVVSIGLALGVGLALGAAQLLRELLFGVAPADPVVLVAVVGLTAGVALVACYVPGRRALRVDPAVALRAE